MSSFFYFIKESLKGFTRNLSTALGSIVTIFLSLLIIGVFLVGGFVVEKLVSSVKIFLNPKLIFINQIINDRNYLRCRAIILHHHYSFYTWKNLIKIQ